MKKVYHINLKIEHIVLDIYFDTKKTAEQFVSFMNQVLRNDLKIEINAREHEVYTKKDTVNTIIEAFDLPTETLK